VSDHRIGSLLHLVGEAIRLELEFGTQSLEALAWIAETVEASVYVPHSLAKTPTGFRFALSNPPLRIGAFSSLLLRVDGTPVPLDRVRVRVGPDRAWRTTTQLDRVHPLELQAGSGLELEADWPLPEGSGPVTVRLELRSLAIPPLVWLEVRDTPRAEGSS